MSLLTWKDSDDDVLLSEYKYGLSNLMQENMMYVCGALKTKFLLDRVC